MKINAGMVLIVFFFSQSESLFGAINGACRLDSVVPNLPKAVCKAPGCLSGDCDPPSMNRETAAISFGEPRWQWNESCPALARTGCWNADMSFVFRLGASDSAGVKEIGVYMAEVVDNGLPSFEKIWGSASSQDSAGRYLLHGNINVQIQPDKNFEIYVYQICAKDREGNAGCVHPSRLMR